MVLLVGGGGERERGRRRSACANECFFVKLAESEGLTACKAGSTAFDRSLVAATAQLSHLQCGCSGTNTCNYRKGGGSDSTRESVRERRGG